MTITSFFDSSRFESSRQPWEIQSPAILTQSRDGLINGIKAGPFDECFSRTHLPDDSLIYKTGGGYLCGGGVGMAQGRGEPIYERYIDDEYWFKILS